MANQKRRALRLVLWTTLLARDVSARVFGGGVSQAQINGTEQVLVNFTTSAGGYVNSWWTGGPPSDDTTTLRFYVDGDPALTVVLNIANACGVAFGDQTAPWGNEWFGKGAKTTGWWNSLPIIFERSIVVTYANAVPTTTWLYVRGTEFAPAAPGVRLGAVDLPPTAKLQLQVTRGTFAPLEYVDLAAVVPGSHSSSYVFAVFLAVDSANLNVLEGCVRAFNAYDNATSDGRWPGVLLGTGTEDYFYSSYYFDAGPFHLPSAGCTHIGAGGRGQQVSMYRVHARDPLLFGPDGFRLRYRIGDTTDPTTGLKCTLEAGGTPAGSPQPTDLLAYAWVYVW